MNQFQVLNSKLAEEFEKQAGPEKKEAPQRKEGDDATVKAASAISENVFDLKLTKREKKVAGPAVHCAFGTITGGFYGAAAELAPVISSGAGLPFGAVFWLAADEAVVPARPLEGTDRISALYARFRARVAFRLRADDRHRASRRP